MYSKSDFYKVADVYNEYKASIVNLAKNTKSDNIDEDEDGATDKAIISLMFKEKFYGICPNEKMLCDILIDLLYDKPNAKGVVWDMCGDVIIDNLLSKSGGIIEYPESVDCDEEFSCCRRRFKMKKISIGGEYCGEV
jgi:hypothetical protein